MAKVFKADECVCCLDEPSSMVIKPCNHACLCEDCSAVIFANAGFCPLCRTAIANVEPLENDAKIPKVPAELKNKYMLTRDDFIKKFHLKIERKGHNLTIDTYTDEDFFESLDDFALDGALVVSASGVSGSGVSACFNPSTQTVDEVFKCYLDADMYMYNTPISRQMTGIRIDMTAGGMTIKKNCNTLTIGDFFKHANERVVSERKLVKHLVDHFYQDFLDEKFQQH